MGMVREGEEISADDRFDRRLFSTAVAHAGRFRCPVWHPRFFDAPPTETYCFVFPRTAVWIEHEWRRPFLADPNTTPVYNPGHAFRRRRVSADVHRADWFAVSPEILREMVAAKDPRAADSELLFRFAAVPTNAATYLAQRRILSHLCSAATPDVLFVEESIVRLLSAVLDSAYREPMAVPGAAGNARDLAEAAREALNTSYRSPDGLVELSARLGCSVFHLCRTFKRQTGSTIHYYRTQLRLRRALELLEGRDVDVLTVALDLGFSSHSHFTHAFHRAFGVTPSQFRVATGPNPARRSPRR